MIAAALAANVASTNYVPTCPAAKPKCLFIRSSFRGIVVVGAEFSVLDSAHSKSLQNFVAIARAGEDELRQGPSLP